MALNRRSDSDDYAQAVTDFASELNRIRNKKGLTIEKVTNQSDISRTSVNTSLGGKELPSARNVIAIASVLGVDEKPLLARRDQIARMLEVPAKQSRKLRNGLVRWWWIPIAAICGALIASVAVLGIVKPTQIPDAAATVNTEVKTGQDPASTECIEDADVVATRTTEQHYLLEIVYSDRCHAGWARFTRNDDAPVGNEIAVRIYVRDSPDGADVQTATEIDVQSIYTTLLVRPDPETVICAEGSASVDRKEVVTQPLCA